MADFTHRLVYIVINHVFFSCLPTMEVAMRLTACLNCLHVKVCVQSSDTNKCVIDFALFCHCHCLLTYPRTPTFNLPMQII